MPQTPPGGRQGALKFPVQSQRGLWLLPTLFLAQLVLVAGCQKSPSYEVYRDPSSGFSLEVPMGWSHEGTAPTATKPVVSTQFIGDAQPQDGGIPLGAVLSVTRLSRGAGEKLLAPTKALFPDDAPTPAESKPYSRDYEHGGPTPLHPNKTPIPMRVEGRVYRTSDAFFVVELCGVRDRFHRNHHALRQALATFRSK